MRFGPVLLVFSFFLFHPSSFRLHPSSIWFFIADPPTMHVVINGDFLICSRYGALAPAKWLEDLDPKVPLQAALEKLLDWHGRAVQERIPAVIADALEIVEHVHQLRVTTRRLAAVLDLFDEELPAEAAASVQKLVGKFRKNCGDARDLDVQRLFFETLVAQGTADEIPGLEALVLRNMTRRMHLQERLRGKFEKRTSKFEQALYTLQAAQHSLSAEAGRRGSFRAAGFRLLPALAAEFWEQAAEGDPLERDAKSIHALRISGKRLRYSLEIFAPILNADFREEIYPRLQKIQDLLGELHDTAVGIDCISEEKQALKASAKKEGRSAVREYERFAAGFRAAKAAYSAREEAAKEEISDIWPHFVSGGCRARLEKSLSTLDGKIGSPGARKKRRTEA